MNISKGTQIKVFSPNMRPEIQMAVRLTCTIMATQRCFVQMSILLFFFLLSGMNSTDIPGTLYCLRRNVRNEILSLCNILLWWRHNYFILTPFVARMNNMLQTLMKLRIDVKQDAANLYWHCNL